MRRRDFITLLGGSAVAWPLAVRAQNADKLPTVGVLLWSKSSTYGSWLAAFVKQLRELGWTDGGTVVIADRSAEERSDRAAEIIAEFVRLKVDVIVTHSTPLVVAAKHATSLIPIVFASAGDPVAAGLVASLARPSGNVDGTGIDGKATSIDHGKSPYFRTFRYRPGMTGTLLDWALRMIASVHPTRLPRRKTGVADLPNGEVLRVWRAV